MNRLTFDADGKITNSLGDYPEAVRQAGKEENAAVIDLNAMSKLFYEALGPVESHKTFAGNDTTHHSNYGSYELAKCIVEGIQQAKLPLVKFLTDDVAPFGPAHPDPIASFDVPAEPMGNTERPYGDSPAPPKGPFEPLRPISTTRNGPISIAWPTVAPRPARSFSTIVWRLVENVSKNGNLLLNFSPRPTAPSPASR